MENDLNNSPYHNILLCLFVFKSNIYINYNIYNIIYT